MEKENTQEENIKCMKIFLSLINVNRNMTSSIPRTSPRSRSSTEFGGSRPWPEAHQRVKQYRLRKFGSTS